MIVTVFRKRMNPDAQGEYDSIAVRMNELVRTIPGYVSHKGFVAADGEQVTIIEFESEQALDQWRIHTEHRLAKRRAIETLFSEYKFQICSVLRERRGPRERSPALGNDRPARLFGPELPSWQNDAAACRSKSDRTRAWLNRWISVLRAPAPCNSRRLRIELWLHPCVVSLRHPSVTNRQQRRIEFIGFLPSAVCLWPWRPLNR
jgi:heme-degrading monooxygenase HmoA